MIILPFLDWEDVHPRLISTRFCLTLSQAEHTAGTPRKIKMGYFFAVLEDQLGLIDEEERDKRTSRTRTHGKKEKGNGDPYAHLIQR